MNFQGLCAGKPVWSTTAGHGLLCGGAIGGLRGIPGAQPVAGLQPSRIPGRESQRPALISSLIQKARGALPCPLSGLCAFHSCTRTSSVWVYTVTTTGYLTLCKP